MRPRLNCTCVLAHEKLEIRSEETTREDSLSKELCGNDCPLVVLHGKEPVGTTKPLGWTVLEWGVEATRRVAMLPVLHDVLPRLAPLRACPIGVLEG
jgi:hypothetical protein